MCIYICIYIYIYIYITCCDFLVNSLVHVSRTIPCKGSYKEKSLVKGNPLYKEINCTKNFVIRKYMLQGNL